MRTLTTRIASFITNAINCVFGGRFWPHVGVKLLEATPSLAQRNSLAPVARIVCSGHAKSAASHSDPRSILGTEGHVMSSMATAAFIGPRLQMIGSHDYFFAARTSTMPIVAALSAMGKTCHNQIVVSATSQVLHSRMLPCFNGLHKTWAKWRKDAGIE